jgi:hypothetical protein
MRDAVNNLDDPRFTIAQVAKAAGISANTLRSWFQRKHFLLRWADKRAADFGDAHLLSLRTALQVGTAVELYRSRVHPARAAKIALAFTHFGDEARHPGELFSKGFTALVAHPEVDDATVIYFDGNTPLEQVFFSRGPGKQVSVLVVWINFVDHRIRTSLSREVP